MGKKAKEEKNEKEKEMTLAEEMFAEQFNQHLQGKETKEYPKILEDM